MEKLTREVLGKELMATLDNKNVTGKILAIARFEDREQVCFQTTQGANGIWIPAFALADIQNWLVTSEKEEDKIVSPKKQADEDLEESVEFFDKLVKDVQRKASEDIDSINKTIEETKTQIEQTILEFITVAQKNVNSATQLINNFMINLDNLVKNLLTQIQETVNKIWSESFKTAISLITKHSKLSFDSAKRKINYLKKNYPDESNRQLARRLTNHLTKISLQKGFIGSQPDLIESIVTFSLELELLEVSTLLTKLIYGIAILHGYNKLDSIDQKEIVAILASSLTIDSLKKLGLECLTQGNNLAKFFLNPVANVALFKLISFSSYLYYDFKVSSRDFKVNEKDNPMISEKAYSEFTTQIQSYLDELFNKQKQLERIVMDSVKIDEQLKALA